MASSHRLTDHVERKSGPVYFLKARDRDGRQIKNRLGPGRRLAAETGARRAARLPDRPWARSRPWGRQSRSGTPRTLGCAMSSTTAAARRRPFATTATPSTGT